MKRALFLILLLNVYYLSFARIVDEELHEDEIYSLLEGYARNIINFNREHPQEKVYLHMDNRSYYIGDTIWFKAYVMNATTLHPTYTSGVLYVELLNDFGAEIERKKFEIRDGMCHGEFALKNDYRTGFYELRAYTRNMLNYGESYLLSTGYLRDVVYVEPANVVFPTDDEGNRFSVTVPIMSTIYSSEEYDEEDSLNTDRRQGYRRHIRLAKKNYTFNRINDYIFSRVFPVYAKPTVAGSYERVMEEYPRHPRVAKPKEANPIQRPEQLMGYLYPEGGMLIDGVESVVAFETTDQWHRKQNVTGHVEDLDGNIISKFSSTSRGRGTFIIRPRRDTPHIVCFNYKDKVYKQPLPYIERQGYAITATPPVDVDADALIEIKASPNNEKEQIGWTLQCRGALLAHDTLSVLPGSQALIRISSTILHGGINQFTLYNTKGEVLADRLLWVTPRADVFKACIADKPDSVAPYDKVTIGIQVGDRLKRNQESVLSISVTDADDSIDSYDTRNIWSELLLSSELKGFIEDVDSYFQHGSKQDIADNLDLLMLVQGWRGRRYEWHTMAGSEPYTPLYAPERELSIDGYVIAETYEPNARIFMADAYPRISGLTINFSLGKNGELLNKTVSCDSAANYTIDIDKPFYGRVPLTMRLNDISKTTENRYWNSQIVINRSIEPQPQRYNYYETAIMKYPIGSDTSCISFPQKVRHMARLENGIYSDRPEIIVDYEKEWNWIIDRGIPCVNYVLEDDTTTKHRHYYLNFPYLAYSLTRMQSTGPTCIKADSVFSKYRGAYYVPYVLPKKVKVYSNLLARALDYNDKLPTSLPENYAIVEHYPASESSKLPPYLPNNGVRHTYFEGFSPSADFYSPDYSSMSLPDSIDYRRTLYWNPNVRTDKRGRATIVFHNNARTKHLHVRAEGITEHGELIVYDSNKQQQ